MGVAVVGDDDARLEGDDVVAVVPLLALRLAGVAAGFDDAQLVQPERFLDDVEDVPLSAADLDAAVAVGAER